MQNNNSILIVLHAGSFFDGCDTENLDIDSTMQKMVNQLDGSLSLIYSDINITVTSDQNSGSTSIINNSNEDQDLLNDRVKSKLEKIFASQDNWIYYQDQD